MFNSGNYISFLSSLDMDARGRWNMVGIYYNLGIHLPTPTTRSNKSFQHYENAQGRFYQKKSSSKNMAHIKSSHKRTSADPLCVCVCVCVQRNIFMRLIQCSVCVHVYTYTFDLDPSWKPAYFIEYVLHILCLSLLNTFTQTQKLHAIPLHSIYAVRTGIRANDASHASCRHMHIMHAHTGEPQSAQKVWGSIHIPTTKNCRCKTLSFKLLHTISVA